jgi:2-polyprenyl-3-methyl-5-hydroxy-6-metoxy-1,4-benzoquinol methylase
VTARFAFGENWESFLQELDDERIEQAERELQDVFGENGLRGRTFLDAGCGSGLFSLAAHRLGASRVVSFDYDEDSVACCRRLRDEDDASPRKWAVVQGDLLDTDFMGSLGRFDRVYCWGVAHHTGSMWDAIDNAAAAVAPGGRLCLGIYNEVAPDEALYDSVLSTRIKRVYNRLPVPAQELAVRSYGLTHLSIRTLLSREDPRTYLERYRRERGMEYWHDIRDWLGGLPFEYATPAAVENHITDAETFEHVRTEVPADLPTAVNTYVFDRKSE